MLLAVTLGVCAGLVAAPPTLAADTTPPVATAPGAAPTPDGTVWSATVPFTVSWAAATDSGSGIARYQLEQSLDGGSWERIALPSATARSVSIGLRPPHDYRFRVRAVDRAGNVGRWQIGTGFRVGRESEVSASLRTTGSWSSSASPGYLGGRSLRSGEAGATATFSFVGSQVAWFGTRTASRGRASVYVDGRYVRTVDLHRATAAYRRILFRHGWPHSGPHTLEIRVVGTAGHPYVDVDGFVVVDPPPADPTLVGAGDVASCSYSTDSRTAALLDRIAGTVFVAGDVAYPSGTSGQFRDCYGPTWGRWRLRTRPSPGNHEYHSAGAAPYFSYFGARAGQAGQGWYAYDLGTWRIYSLNSNCTVVGCGPGSPQERWLRADLAANPRACVAAVWHAPLFSSGEHGGDPAVAPLWRALEEAGADLVINGHDHDYERFAPQDSTGQADVTGIREFVVGTGGAALRPFPRALATSQVREAGTHGILRLTLSPGTYDWQFVPVAGESFTDGGSAACH